MEESKESNNQNTQDDNDSWGDGEDWDCYGDESGTTEPEVVFDMKKQDSDKQKNMIQNSNNFLSLPYSLIQSSHIFSKQK